MTKNYIIDSFGNKLYIINHNRITFLSQKPQKYFNRNRKKRLQKKLNVNSFLKVVFNYSFIVDSSSIEEQDLMDNLIETSYYDKECNLPIKEYFLTFASETPLDNKYYITSLWEIYAPNPDTLEKRIESIKYNIEQKIKHEENKNTEKHLLHVTF